MEIGTALFAYMQTTDKFEIKKFIKSLSMENLIRWNKESMLPNTLLTIYQKGKIDIEELKTAEGIIVAEPLGELDLLWVLSNLPKNYLSMKKIYFETADQAFEFKVDDGNICTTIEMTNFVIEVER